MKIIKELPLEWPNDNPIAQFWVLDWRVHVFVEVPSYQGPLMTPETLDKLYPVHFSTPEIKSLSRSLKQENSNASFHVWMIFLGNSPLYKRLARKGYIEQWYENTDRKDVYTFYEKAGLLDKLTDRERQIVGLYMNRGETLKVIGRVLQLSPSRISQIKRQAKRRLIFLHSRDFSLELP